MALSSRWAGLGRMQVVRLGIVACLFFSARQCAGVELHLRDAGGMPVPTGSGWAGDWRSGGPYDDALAGPLRSQALGLGAASGSTPTSEDDPNVGSPASFVRGGKLDVKAVVDYFEDLYRADRSISTAEIRVVKPRRTKTMRLKIWTRGREQALIVVQAPPREAGTATLKVEENLWNYFPRIRRTIRIPPSMMRSSWMGTDFTNDDLVRESSYEEDYVYELIGRVEDPNGWLIRFTAKPETVGLWERFDLVVSLDGTIPVRARYYDRQGRHARTMYWSDVRVFDGRRLPAHLKLVPEDEEGQWTEMRYLDIDFDVELPASMFSLSELERIR